jgi:hypothetical protein
MEKFAVGDLVECIDFRGATGQRFRPGFAYEVTKVDYSGEGDEVNFLYLDGNNINGAYVERFILASTPKMPEPEMDLDEIHLAQELVKG